MVVAHFHTIQESLEAVAMKTSFIHEMMDDTILNCTKTNREQAKTDFFIQGNPKRLLCSKWHRITVWKMPKYS
jgi:hypothetical protein